MCIIKCWVIKHASTAISKWRMFLWLIFIFFLPTLHILDHFSNFHFHSYAVLTAYEWKLWLTVVCPHTNWHNTKQLTNAALPKHINCVCLCPKKEWRKESRLMLAGKIIMSCLSFYIWINIKIWVLLLLIINFNPDLYHLLATWYRKSAAVRPLNC